MKRAIFLLTALMAAGLLQQGLHQLPLVHANGGPDARDILDAQVGGYHLLVIASPGRPPTGTVHLTFSLMDRQKSHPIKGAGIMLTATPPVDSGIEASTYVAAPSSMNPDVYDTNVTLTVSGDWTFDISVDGSLGEAGTTLVLEVVERGSKILAIVIVVVTFPALLLALEAWRRWDRRRKRQRSG